MNKYTKRRKILFKIKQLLLLLTIISAIIFGVQVTINTGAKVVLDSDINSLKKPISILLMGGDTSEERQTQPLIDSIILLTINPKNERNNTSVDILSIPRDTKVEYVTSEGPTNTYGKINASYGIGASTNIDDSENAGIQAMINTVENFLNTDIDYYAYTNFEGLVSIIDSIHGIDINVPYDFCEQNSKDEANSVCLTAGPQTLNGEQALAYARQRKAINPETGASGDDWERNIRQQEVIGAILNKIVKDPKASAIPVYKAMNDGAIKTNLDVGILSQLANFGINLYNTINNKLTNQGSINFLIKESDYNHKVAIDSTKNLFNASSVVTNQTLADLYPEHENSIYYENTNVNLLNYNYKNTSLPTVEKADMSEPMTIEISFATIGTSDDQLYGTSEQIVDEETLEYYQEYINQAKNQN